MILAAASAHVLTILPPSQTGHASFRVLPLDPAGDPHESQSLFALLGLHPGEPEQGTGCKQESPFFHEVAEYIFLAHLKMHSRSCEFLFEFFSKGLCKRANPR